MAVVDVVVVVSRSSLRGVFAAPTLALPHGVGNGSAVVGVVVVVSNKAGIPIRQPLADLPAIHPLPRGGGRGGGQQINRAASGSLGFAFFQFIQNGSQYGMGLLQDFVIPEADNGESQVLQVLCPRFVISGLFGVLAAVYFDNQFGFHADEIEDVLAQRLLAAEAIAA